MVGPGWRDEPRAVEVSATARGQEVKSPAPGPTARQLGVSRFALFVGAVALSVVLDFTGARAQPAPVVSDPVKGKLISGDIVYADSGDAIHGGFIIKVDPTSGDQTVISSGGYLQLPFDPLVDASGEIIVSDNGRLIRISPETGKQTVIADKNQTGLGLPYGLAFNGSGELLVANLQAIIQVQPRTGQIQVVAEGDNLSSPLAVVEGGGQLYVLSVGTSKRIIRVNLQTGAKQVISQGGYFKNPQALAIHYEELFVTDVATSDGNFGVGRVLRIDARTGAQTVVAEGGYLVGPVGITMDQAGELIVGDPYTVNRKSPDLYNGGIIRINPATGHQTLVARGHGSFVNPRGVAIVPILTAAHK